MEVLSFRGDLLLQTNLPGEIRQVYSNNFIIGVPDLENL